MVCVCVSHQFCGSTIAGLSLLSDSVMRLVSEENPADRVHLFLQRCSLYILRYEVTVFHFRTLYLKKHRDLNPTASPFVTTPPESVTFH